MEELSTCECQVQFSEPGAMPGQMGKVCCALPVVAKTNKTNKAMVFFIEVKIGFIQTNLRDEKWN
jgi:hypothetical protein